LFKDYNHCAFPLVGLLVLQRTLSDGSEPLASKLSKRRINPAGKYRRHI